MDLKLLEKLTTTPGVPGREYRVRELIRGETEDLFDEMHVDAMGSLHGVRKPRPGKGKSTPKKPTKVMVAAHMDQIGFLVRHIDDKGFLRLNPVGGFDTRNLFARMVTVTPDVRDPKKDLDGILNAGGKPVHIASEEEKKKVPEIGEFFVDLGLPPDQVKKKVRIGDMVTIKAPVYEIGKAVAAQCLDNRIACYVAIQAVRKLAAHRCELHVVFTVQEEVGLRGAGPAAYEIRPDIGIALDTTLCCDTPGVPETDVITRFGEGVGLNVMDSAAIADLELLEEIEAIANKRNIKAQRTILHRGGTDAGTMQRAGSGVRVATLLTPTRYIHTVTEMSHREDMQSAVDLLAAYLEQVK